MAKAINVPKGTPTIKLQGTDLPIVGKISSPIHSVSYNDSRERFMLKVNATQHNPSKREDGKTVIYLDPKGLEILFSEYGFEASTSPKFDALRANRLIKQAGGIKLVGLEVYLAAKTVVNKGLANEVVIKEPHIQNVNLGIEAVDDMQATEVAYAMSLQAEEMRLKAEALAPKQAQQVGIPSMQETANTLSSLGI